MSAAIRKKKKPTVMGEVLLWHITDELKKKPDAEHTKRVRYILERLVELKDYVGKYGAIEILRELRDPIDRYRFKYELSVGRGVHAGLGTAHPDPSPEESWECGAVLALIKLLDQPDGLDRVRKCECGTLFFAVQRFDQKHCASICRQRSYDRDPAKREQKLASMRERYATLKKLAANPKSGVGLRAPKRSVAQ